MALEDLILSGCYSVDIIIGPRGPFPGSPGNLPGPISIFLIFFFTDYTVITDMVLGQRFHIIIRL